MTPPWSGTCSRPMPREPEVEVEERLQDRARQPVDERVDALGARPGVEPVVGARMRFAAHVLGYPATGGSLQSGHAPDGYPNPARRPGGRGGRRGVGRPAAARPPRLRRPLRRHRAARALGGVLRRRLAGGRVRPARGQRRRCSARSTRTSRPRCRSRPRCAARSPAWPSTSRRGPAPPWSSACTPRGADLPQLWGSGRAFAQATWRHVALRLRARRARAAAQPARGHPRPGRRRGRLDQRPRLGRAPGRPGTRLP